MTVSLSLIFSSVPESDALFSVSVSLLFFLNYTRTQAIFLHPGFEKTGEPANGGQKRRSDKFK